MIRSEQRYENGEVEIWEARGVLQDSQNLGVITFLPDKSGGHAMVNPNTYHRVGRVSQGNRKENDLLCRDHYFPILYLFVKCECLRTLDWEFMHLRDLLARHSEFKRVTGYIFSPDGESRLRCCARDEMKRILFDAALKGPDSLEMVAKAMKAIDTKTEQLTFEEREFLQALTELVEELEEVPTQNEFRIFFIERRKGRTEDQFKKLRDSLGFKWLPRAKRGPQVGPKKKKGGRSHPT